MACGTCFSIGSGNAHGSPTANALRYSTYIVMAYISMAYMVMTYIVMAYIVMADGECFAVQHRAALQHERAAVSCRERQSNVGAAELDVDGRDQTGELRWTVEDFEHVAEVWRCPCLVQRLEEPALVVEAITI